ncbi:uncharacterized protein LOC125553469 [Triticum urartu]|uniref:uncharacterized protein LOC125541563 n=1 Tax=Triticum urartu TaxID=4572 RepID=UPI0020443712|nr:uncharacterized protein LOC125541563 [Triticum urartu]XP_048573206.1 uncharacterized protein LOC125553469 [Triticum urartu]
MEDKPTKKVQTKNKAPKKPTKKKTNPPGLFNLDDDESEDDAEGSHADGEEKQQHEARRTTWNNDGGVLSSGLPNTPVPHKRHPEGTSHSSSGDSTGTQVPLFKTVPGKKLKVNKPSEDPKVADLEKHTMSESLPQASEAAMDDPPPEEHPVTMDPINIDP